MYEISVFSVIVNTRRTRHQSRQAFQYILLILLHESSALSEEPFGMLYQWNLRSKKLH